MYVTFFKKWEIQQLSAKRQLDPASSPLLHITLLGQRSEYSENFHSTEFILARNILTHSAIQVRAVAVSTFVFSICVLVYERVVMSELGLAD